MNARNFWKKTDPTLQPLPVELLKHEMTPATLVMSMPLLVESEDSSSVALSVSEYSLMTQRRLSLKLRQRTALSYLIVRAAPHR